MFLMPFKWSFYRFPDDYRGGGWSDCLKESGRVGLLMSIALFRFIFKFNLRVGGCGCGCKHVSMWAQK